jgi:hypothetical protein
LIAVAAITLITVFGDNIRRLFGTPSGALGGQDLYGDAQKKAECESLPAVIRVFDSECREIADREANRDRLRALGINLK